MKPFSSNLYKLVIKAGRRLDILSYLMYRLDRKSLEKMLISYVRPILEYGDIMFSNMTDEQSLLIENVNKRAGKIISGATAGTSTSIIYDEL